VIGDDVVAPPIFSLPKESMKPSSKDSCVKIQIYDSLCFLLQWVLQLKENNIFLFAIRSFGCDENLGVASNVQVNEGVQTRTMVKVIQEASRIQILQEASRTQTLQEASRTQTLQNQKS